MAMASSSSFSTIHPRSFTLPTQNHHFPLPSLSIISRRRPHSHSNNLFTPRPPITAIYASTNGGGGSGGEGGGGGDGGGDDGESEGRDRNREEALLVLTEVGKSLESLPADLAEAVKAGRVPGSIVKRFFELQKSSVFRWLLNFGGFRERLLADDLFLAKVAMECGVGIFTKVSFSFHINFDFDSLYQYWLLHDWYTFVIDSLPNIDTLVKVILWSW